MTTSIPRILGDYTAAGHRFGDNMKCDKCGTAWKQHQKAPDLCPRSNQCKHCREPSKQHGLCAEHFRKWEAGERKRREKVVEGGMLAKPRRKRK